MDNKQVHFFEEQFEACKQAFYLVAGLSFAINLLMLTVPLYMLQIYDRVLSSYSYATLFYLTLIAIFALVIMGLLDIARSRIFLHVTMWLNRRLSPAALERTADNVLAGDPYGTQCQRDITSLTSFISSAGIFSLFDAPWVPVYMLVIFMLHVYEGVLAVIGAIILFVIAYLNDAMTRDLIKQSSGMSLHAQRTIDISMRNAEVIQAMGMMGPVIRAWEKKQEPVLKIQQVIGNRSSLFLSISKFVRLVLQLLVLGLGAFLVLHNEMTAGSMVACSILLGRALAPVEQSIGLWKQLTGVRQSYQMLKAFFARPQLRGAGIDLPRPKGNLSIENVYFKPVGAEAPVLQGITAEIEAGDFVALIGPTGAGKSTLARILCGAIAPTVGIVRLDGADVYKWDRAAFGKFTGYLPQDVELFPGTVKENIARMGEVDDAAVIEAAQLAGVHDKILRLSHGYDTEIGMTQHGLSGGQRQHIALARALYKNPVLVILDEANSNLDYEGEEALLKAVLELKRRKATIILIAHRPAIVRYVDKIIVLNEGRIQFMGPRDEILGKLGAMAGNTAAVKQANF